MESQMKISKEQLAVEAYIDEIKYCFLNNHFEKVLNHILHPSIKGLYFSLARAGDEITFKYTYKKGDVLINGSVSLNL